jgi:gentisate 1,2-dioxygenase
MSAPALIAERDSASSNRKDAHRLDALRSASSLEALYPQLASLSISAGWAKPEPSLWPAPRQNFVPHRWRYRDAHAAFEPAMRLVSTEQAERRNFVLCNPIPGNTYATLRTLIVAYQAILPQEQARSHRHTPNALRLVLDAGGGAFTTVDGAKIPMHNGDVVLTPSWCWHGHGHDGDRPAVWVDYLDVPLVQLLEPMFYEPHPQEFEHGATVASDSPMVFAFAKTEALLANAPVSLQFGRQIELGAPALPTLGLFMMQLSPGMSTQTVQTTANNVYTVVRGTGCTVVDDESFAWETGDVIAVPAWRAHWHRADADTILFRVTDAPALAKLGFLRSAARA